MLLTFQSPNASATTATAAAVAFAAVRVMSLACMPECFPQPYRLRIGEFADELRRAGIPVVVVTGTADITQYRDRADQVLSKPFEPSALVAAARRFVG